MTDTMEAVRKGGKAHEAEDPKKGPTEGTTDEPKKVNADEAVLFDDVETSDEKALKWRFLAKGAALDDILAVAEARAVEGEKQVSFKVANLGDRELGEIIRAFFAKAHGAGVVLRDLLAVVRAKATGIDVKATLDKLVEQATRKPEKK